MKGGEICVMRRGERWNPYSKGIFESMGGERGEGDQVPLDNNAPMLPGWDYLQVRYEERTLGLDSVHRCNNTPGILNGDCVKFGLVRACGSAGSRHECVFRSCGTRSRKTRRGSGCNVRFPRSPEAWQELSYRFRHLHAP